MSHSLNSLKELIQGIIWVSITEIVKEDARSLDNGSHKVVDMRQWRSMC